ncbi:Uncharacterized N-terminal domain of lipid-A-disaccharide synthase [Singulisphaera sp. GP187]|uniref:lipid-A-disaccharide synthase N-terminal domain-containing protein n=1 Tax=Singulisphaera sp. GP187 TaxID=1882752 RepID=UPI000929B281|nr:lipid-A-disaccharide synthase N-terminal domain-containing protein [Singulisphaera sp. GP187]SIO56634.1 Uncharacterized N-terminal domain of lipid-A-disaccharide synthase [Singulisphaera sp. GP187]
MSDLSRLFSDLWSVLWGMSLWVKIGFLGQAAFTARFLVQWVASEKKKASVVPVAFWWLSIIGGLVLLAYAIHNRDPVIIVGQATGLLVYIRNLMLVQRARSRGAKRTKKDQKDQGEPAELESTTRPHRVDSAAKKIPWS